MPGSSPATAGRRGLCASGRFVASGAVGIYRHRLDSAGVEVAAPLTFPDHPVLDEQAHEGALLIQVEAIPTVGCHAFADRAVEVRVDDQLVEPSPRLQQASMERILRGEDCARLIRWAP